MTHSPTTQFRGCIFGSFGIHKGGINAAWRLAEDEIKAIYPCAEILDIQFVSAFFGPLDEDPARRIKRIWMPINRNGFITFDLHAPYFANIRFPDAI